MCNCKKLENGKNLQKYSPTHGKQGVDLFFFGDHHGKILLVDMVASKKKKKKRLTPGFPSVGLYFCKSFPLLQ